jgi:hypothetical protein
MAYEPRTRPCGCKVGRPPKPRPVINPKNELRKAKVLKQAAEMTNNESVRRKLMKEAEEAELLAVAA